MGQMIPKEMKGRRSTAATRHLYQLQCSKINVKKIAFGSKEHYRLENGSLGFIETLHKQ